MKSVILFRILFLLLAAGIGANVARAQDLGAVKARMEQRIATIDELKTRGAVGENNRGYLEARGAATGSDQQVISAENSDRLAVYTALAKQTGSDPDTVGRRRAQQIALGSKRGVWIQAQNGEWTQKG
jgi:uncharacterized protein YdbL (DUF1318 family)